MEGRLHMSVYFQWSLKGQTCLQTPGLRTAAPGKRPFPDQSVKTAPSRSMLVVGLTWCLEQRPAPLWTHGPIPPLKAPLPPAPGISPGCQVSLLPVDTSPPPRFSGSSQFQTGCQCGRAPGRAGAGSGSGTWGDEAKCCKEGAWEARGTARPRPGLQRPRLLFSLLPTKPAMGGGHF